MYIEQRTPSQDINQFATDFNLKHNTKDMVFKNSTSYIY